MTIPELLDERDGQIAYWRARYFAEHRVVERVREAVKGAEDA